MRKVASKPPPRHSHQWLDLVNLKMCRRIAQKIRRDPSLMRIPRKNLRHWKKINPQPAVREWEKILQENPTERVLKILTQENDEGQRLRQSDPFVGILTEKERRTFLELDE